MFYRALGDYEYKNVEGKSPCEQMVSPEPEVSVIDRNLEADEFLVLACDGVWDVMTNKNLCDFIRSRLLISDDLQLICNQVADTCLYKVRIVALKPFHLGYLALVKRNEKNLVTDVVTGFISSADG